MVENSAEDAARTLQALSEGGFTVDCLRVQTNKAFSDALTDRNWDVILSEYTIPDIDAEEALSMLHAHDLSVPLIVVSGCIGETAAAHLMKEGADDFVMKGNTARLVPAIRRSLSEVDNRKRYQLAQSALQTSEARFRAITSNIPGMMFQLLLERHRRISFTYVSDGSLSLLGLHPQTLMEDISVLVDMIVPKDRILCDQLRVASARNLSTWNWEGRIRIGEHKEIKWVSLRATPRRISGEETLWDGILINITKNKLAEIENARSREQLAELSSYLQKIKEQERASIAREIHDDIGGTLTAIKCELVPLADNTARKPFYYRKKARSIEALVDRVIESTYRISMDLRPGILDCGIVAAVKWQAKEFSDRAGISCRIFCDNDDIPLDADLAVAIFRIFQETLTNISKHAEASRLQIRIAEKDGWVFLEIADNGKGITNPDMTKPQSFGIRGMRERCQQLSGSFHITGAPGKGTRVTISVPMNGMETSPERTIKANITLTPSQSISTFNRENLAKMTRPFTRDIHD